MKINYCTKCDRSYEISTSAGWLCCPFCGGPLVIKPEDRESEVDVEKSSLSVLIAAALVTPKGQRLVRKVLEKIDEKFFK